MITCSIFCMLIMVEELVNLLAIFIPEDRCIRYCVLNSLAFACFFEVGIGLDVDYL